jgi:hypothetical protein
MPEYDAFGREIGEDSLAGWRTAEPAASPAPPADPPAPAAQPPVEAPPVAAAPRPEARARPRPRTRRRPRVVSRLIVLLVVVVAGANLVAGASHKVKDAVDDLPTLSPPSAVTPKAAPAGLQPGSLIRAGELRRALAELRRRDIGRLQTLRLAPERIDAALLTRRSTLVSVQLRSDGEFQRFSESGGGFRHLDTMPYARLDPTAPQRLVRAAAERLHRPVSAIDYVVPSITDGKITWGAYFKGGAIFLANAHGTITRRI